MQYPNCQLIQDICFFSVHSKLVYDGGSGRYLIDIGDIGEGVIKNINVHRSAAKR